MKLNLPTTWTSQKMSSLLLITLFNAYQTNAGDLFNNCLGGDSSGKYKLISSFANNIADKQTFCCNVSLNSCSSAPLATCYFPSKVQCNKIGNSKFCVFSDKNWRLCGGIIGNNLTTDTSLGQCPPLGIIKDTLNTQSTSPNFSWLCCDTNSCTVPINVVIDNNIKVANTNCLSNQWSLMCFQDNDGWSCTGSVSSNFDNIDQSIGSCVLQFTAPINANAYTSTIKSSSSNTLPVSPNNANSNQSGMSLPVIIAIVVPSGVLLITATTVALYYRHQLKKNRGQNREQENDINLQPISTQQQYQLALQEEEPYQAHQVQVNPYHSYSTSK